MSRMGFDKQETGHLRAEVVVSMQAISEHTDQMLQFLHRTDLPAGAVLSCMSDAIQGLVLTAGFWRSTITKDPACAWFGMCWLSRRCGIGCHRAVFRVWLLAGLRPAF